MFYYYYYYYVLMSNETTPLTRRETRRLIKDDGGKKTIRSKISIIVCEQFTYNSAHCQTVAWYMYGFGFD